MRRGTSVTAHIIRDFKGVDPVRYHAAVRLQAESVPLNVAKNTTRRASETARTGLLIVVWIVTLNAKEILGQDTNEEEADIFYDAESEPTAASDPKASESSSRFDSSADLFD